MTCTNDAAESPFATVRVFLDIYPRYYYPSPSTCTFPLQLHLTLTPTLHHHCNIFCGLKLREVAMLSQAMMNGTHRPSHKVGKKMMRAGTALTAPENVKTAVSTLCSVRRRSPQQSPSPTTNPCLINCAPNTPFFNATIRSVNSVLSSEQHIRCRQGCPRAKKNAKRRRSRQRHGHTQRR
jgi:hypothetical protein